MLRITLKVKEFNLAPPVGSEVSRSTCVNGMRPDPLFATGAYTASDKCPVEKIAVWPSETKFSYTVKRKILAGGNFDVFDA